ncbi:MAG: FHA domain-containing protein, partial [Bdellovibrionia bacterium]
MNRVAQLTVLKDGVEVKNHLIEGSVVLGRGKESDLRLEDQAISRQHAVFSFKGDQLFVEKKSEFGHLQVNGADLSTSELKNNDILMIGSFLIRVSIPSGSAQDSQSSQASGDSRSPQESVESKASPLPPSDEKQPSGVQPKPVLEPSQVQAQGHLDPLESAEEPPVPGEKNPGGLQDDPFAQDSDQALDSPAVGLESVDSQESVESQDPLESLGSSENSDEPPLQGSSENSADAELPELKLEGSGFQENSGESVESSQMISDDAKTRVLGLSALSVRLVFPLGSANCTEYEIEKNEVIIGRGKDCDIVLNDKKASRKNTVVRRAGVNFVIEDLDSSNGTYVNGVRISEQ